MLLSSLLTFFFMGSAVSTGAVACNGNAALCSRLYSNVSLIGTHDSAFVGILPTDNQDVSVATQLDDGIRFLQAQTHYFLDELSMCHTSCYELYAGTLTSYLSSIKTWIDDNPNQVVTLLLTNGDFVDVSLFGTAFSSVGLDTYAYTPSEQLTMSEWPTLQQLIHAGTPLVVFLGKFFELGIPRLL
jgi:hypothetical protein